MNYAVPTIAGVFAFGATVAIFSSAYVINEGNVGVITRMGRAVEQEGPNGLQFKTPFIMGVQEFDVRERALPVALNGTTFEGMPVVMEISVNWQPDPARAMEIFVKYGGPQQFADNTVTPRLRQSLKATTGKFSASRMIRERENLANEMLTNARTVLESYPAIFNSVQIENFELPQRYMEAVLATQESAEAAKKAEQELARQDFEAKEAVQTANAARDATKAAADGEAYSITTVATAEADRTRMRGEADADALLAKYNARAEGQANIVKALGSGLLAVEFSRALGWDGKLPTTVMGDQPGLIMEFSK